MFCDLAVFVGSLLFKPINTDTKNVIPSSIEIDYGYWVNAGNQSGDGECQIFKKIPIYFSWA